MNNTTYKSVDEAWEAGNEWVEQSDRFDKMNHIQETCTKDFVEGPLVDEILRRMTEKDFNELFNHLRRNWDIKTPQELDYAMNF